MTALRNWAGNYEYGAARLHRPEAVGQVQELAARCERLKVLGSRHSFNGVADTTGDLLSLERLDRIDGPDPERRLVTVEAGVRYGSLVRSLHREGWALHNLASLPHISVAGACATATHGSGDGSAGLAAAVSALEFVTAGGETVTLSRERDGEAFRGAVVGLGGLGIVTRLTLDIVPAFAVRQDVYEGLSLERAGAHFDEIMSAAYSVSLFTDWRGAAFNSVWLKSRADESFRDAGPEFFGARRAVHALHPIPGVSPENCTEQGGVPGPWHERLPHFRAGYTPSSGDELQSEYLVPRHHAVAALRAVYELRERVAPLLLISEVRTVAADALWMSPCCGRDCAALHFTWKKDWPAVRELLPLLEERLAPFDARPHWGKLFATPPERIRALYERLPDFQSLLRRYDPAGKFRNAFLDAVVFGMH